jgi:hypothetical protein
LNPEVGEALAEVKRTNVAVLPIKSIDPTNKRETKIATEIMSSVEAMVTACKRQTTLLGTLRQKILHTQHRTPTSLGHYLQKDYADIVTAEILIDDVMRKGFLHKIDIEADEASIVVSARVSATAKEEPEIVPILRMRFAHAPLRQFVYACGRLFLALNARRKRWTTGRQPEEIYRRLVNTEEPLVFFHATSIDNLRAITGLMEAVAAKASVSDLAALEHEIKATDKKIDDLVYELYDLAEEEIEIVKDSVPSPF